MKGRIVVSVNVLIISLCTLYCPTALQARDFWVHPSGSGVVCTRATPCSFQQALTLAANNQGEDDTIWVGPGTYTITSTLEYSGSYGDGTLTIRPQDPSNPPLLKGDGNVQILVIEHLGYGDLGSDIHIQGISFQNGKSDNYGGAISVNVYEADVTVSNCTFSGNSGGAISIWNYEGDLILRECSFSDNTGIYQGGAVWVWASNGNATISNCTFERNQSPSEGGALYATIYKGNLKLEHNTFRQNSSSYMGSALYLIDDESGKISVVHNNLVENGSGVGEGTCLVYVAAGTAVVANNILAQNRVAAGGGALGATVRSGTLVLTNNTIYGNSGYHGIQLTLNENSARARIYNNIVYGNSSQLLGASGKELFISSDGDNDGIGSTVELFNNLIGRRSDFSSANSTDFFLYNATNYTHGNNLSKDPRLVDPSNGNFHLKAGSPCIDAGANSAPSIPAKDLDQAQRIVDGNGDGSAVVDIGADEFSTSTSSDSSNNSQAKAYKTAIARIEKDGQVYLYLPSLGVEVSGELKVYELLFKLEDLKSITFKLHDLRPVTSSNKEVSALFAPQRTLVYLPYLAIVMDDGTTTLAKNLFFKVEMSGNYIFLVLNDYFGDTMPTMGQYQGGQTNPLGQVDAQRAKAYLDTMKELQGILGRHGVSMHEAQSGSEDFNWTVGAW